MKQIFQNIIEKYDPLTDFRVLANLGISLVGFIFLTPFAVYNLLLAHYFLGLGAMLLVLISLFIIISILLNKYRKIIPFITFTPTVIIIVNMLIVKQGIIGILWSYPVIISIYFMLTEKKAWLANFILLVTAIPQIFLNIEPFIAVRASATMACVSVCSAIFIRIILYQQNLLKKRALIDPLTKLYNRNILDITLEQAVAQSQRTKTQVSLLAIDIDHFKKINDTKGHDAGDMVLRGLGVFLKSQIKRKADKAFRTGGEEFLLMLYGTDKNKAKIFAETLRAKIENQSFIPGFSVKASIGVAALKKDENINEWLKRCDENLYLAKKQGRNRVIG
ncbi:MAG: GGDEF domain-containing protein [Spirochaetia bacterium]|nr:GGDEF domain-containing protein [Spirochaetia bacterium]